MSIPRHHARPAPQPVLQEISAQNLGPQVAGTKKPPAATVSAATAPLHVVYVSGGTDLTGVIKAVEGAMERHGLRHASVVADGSLQGTPTERTQAFLERLRSLFARGEIGPDTRIIVQLHGGMEDDGYMLEATGVLDALRWDELRNTLRHPTQDKHWNGDVIVGCCEAGLMADTLPHDEGTYMLMSGKKSVSATALRQEYELLFDFIGAHVRKKNRMPSSDSIWKFLTQASGENLRRVDAHGLRKAKAGAAHVSKLAPGKSGKRALTAAQARQPVMQFISKLLHGSARSVAAIINAHPAQFFSKDPTLKIAPPLTWMINAERDIASKISLLFAAGYTNLRVGNQTILHEAVREDKRELLQALLSQDIDIDARDDAGCTALHLAARLGNEAMVRLLLDHGADVRAVDQSHMTAAQHAEVNGQREIADRLKQRSSLPDESFSSFSNEGDDG